MKVEILASPEAWRATPVQEAWKALCRGSENLEVIYQSPEWFEHRVATEPRTTFLVAVARDDGGRIVGVLPMARLPTDLDFVVGARSFGQVHVPTLMVFGGEPLMSEPDTAIGKALLDAVAQASSRREAIF